MHHIHISTGFMFFGGLLLLGFVWLIVWAVTTVRRDRLEAERAWRAPEPSMSMFASRADYDTARRSTPPAGYAAAAPVAAPVVQPVYHSSGGTDLLTGVLIGEALAGHHTTVIHDTAPMYVDSSPVYVDSGFTYDSGPSCDSGGGFDASW
jgi:hypothetical protein